MSATKVYQQVYRLLGAHFDHNVDESTLHRMTLLVIGIIQAKSASPAKIASALHTLGLREATIESLERQIRRTENDSEVDVALCFHPFARHRLLLGRTRKLILIIDPTTQDDRVVMMSVAVWYRGRALPLAWMIWPANTPLEGLGFWERIAMLLEQVAGILPAHTTVTWLADRAFGTPTFTDMLTERGWHYVVRIQGQTRYLDRMGVERKVQSLVPTRGKRAKMSGKAFKKSGWREVNLVAYWGNAHKSALCLASDLEPEWDLIKLYRRRYPIEATFRDYKSYGWHWEHGQVTDLQHLERLLVGMALATWIALFVGKLVADEILHKPASGNRRTLPWHGKRSLFTLGLHRLHEWIAGTCSLNPDWLFTDWDTHNWSYQIYAHHSHAFVFAHHALSSDF
ncbi:transposase [Chloroflexota bacterium]